MLHPPTSSRPAWWKAGLALALLLPPGGAGAAGRETSEARNEKPDLRGQWMLDGSLQRDQVHLAFRIRREHGNSSWGRTVPIARLEGLPPDALERDVESVSFRLVRSAGTFRCRGSMSNEHGAGTFELVLDPSFPAELERRGVGRPTEAEQARLAYADAGFEVLDALEKEKYPKPDIGMFIRMADHGVNQRFVEGLAGLGHRFGSLRTLVEARDHGVDPEFVRGLQEAGFTMLSYEELRTARDHGVDGEYVKGMRELGVGSRTLDELIELRNHGVDAEYVKEMRGLGAETMTIEELIRLRDHGVDGEYVREMRELGGERLTIDELVRLRDHGVDVEYVKDMRESGYAKAALDELRQARDHGVDVRYVEALAEAGFTKLSLASVIRARDHGLSGAQARRARERLGRDATIDDAIAWRDRGGR